MKVGDKVKVLALANTMRTGRVGTVSQISEFGAYKVTVLGLFPNPAIPAVFQTHELKVKREITIDDARRILDEKSNGALEGISDGKGGRAWLDGEWLLSELEALCIVIRHNCGENAEGAAELVAQWEAE